MLSLHWSAVMQSQHTEVKMEKQECEEWFTPKEEVNFKVKGKEFSYLKPSGGVQNSWMNEFMEIKTINQTEENPKGEQMYVKNIERFNLCKLQSITKTPFSPELIQKILQLAKPTEWETLDKKQRENLLKELLPGLFEEIIIQINKISSRHEEQKKN